MVCPGRSHGIAVEALGGNPRAFGKELFTTFLYPFEVVSLVLIVAMIGAVILTRKGDPEAESAPGPGGVP